MTPGKSPGAGRGIPKITSLFWECTRPGTLLDEPWLGRVLEHLFCCLVHSESAICSSSTRIHVYSAATNWRTMAGRRRTRFLILQHSKSVPSPLIWWSTRIQHNMSTIQRTDSHNKFLAPLLSCAILSLSLSLSLSLPVHIVTASHSTIEKLPAIGSGANIPSIVGLDFPLFLSFCIQLWSSSVK